MSELVYILDGAPITVRGNDNWSSKVFNRHLPVLYFYQLLQQYNEAIVTPVIDVVKQGRFSELESLILRDFQRRTCIENLQIIDESQRKMPTDEDRIREYIDFLNSIEYDLRRLDTNSSLEFQGERVVGFSARLCCTIAEILVYHDKMQMANGKDVVMMTGYDESYLGLYGQESEFTEFTPVLVRALESYFHANVEVVGFMYARNPKGSFREYEVEFSRLSDEEQQRVLITNAAYVLTMAQRLKDGNLEDVKQVRQSCGEYSSNMEEMLKQPIRNQQEFDELIRQL